MIIIAAMRREPLEQAVWTLEQADKLLASGKVLREPPGTSE